MNDKLTCFKCWQDKAKLTYEENRLYKVSCECGCSYEFEHSSFKQAELYHYNMLELYGEIDTSKRLKAENAQLKAKLDKAIEDMNAVLELAERCVEPCEYCDSYKKCHIQHRCETENYGRFKWRGLEGLK